MESRRDGHPVLKFRAICKVPRVAVGKQIQVLGKSNMYSRLPPLYPSKCHFFVKKILKFISWTLLNCSFFFTVSFHLFYKSVHQRFCPLVHTDQYLPILPQSTVPPPVSTILLVIFVRLLFFDPSLAKSCDFLFCLLMLWYFPMTQQSPISSVCS